MVLKENINSCTPEVKWIGSPSTDVTVPRLAHREVYFYQRCIFGELTLSVGDCVLVSNADAAEPDTVDGCDIARVVHLYELRDMSDRDPYRAIVQWYSRPECIPHKEFDQDDICIDFAVEVVEEYRPYDPDISLETIFRKCSVVCGSSEDSAGTLLKQQSIKQKKVGPMFVCRYKFIKVKKAYRLVPLEFTGEAVDDPNTESTRKTRRKSLLEDANFMRLNDGSGRSHKSASAHKPKASFAETKRRRASVAATTAMEFIDVNYLRSEGKVSPIKIVGGRNVVRMSAKKSAPASPLVEHNSKVTPNSRVTAARRNLNLSLEKGADTSVESDCLNYSIVKTPTSISESPNSMKIKLRLSDRQRPSKLAAMEEQFQDPLAFEDCPSTAKFRTDDIYSTPTKKSKCIADVEVTPSTRRKSILKSAARRQVDSTPKRSIQLSDIVEKRVFNDDDIISTPKRKHLKKAIEVNEGVEPDMKRFALKNATTGRRNSTAMSMTPSQKLKLMRCGEISPTLEQRQTPTTKGRKSDLQLARERLHVSVVPKSLPCREKEFDNIYAFLESKIEDQCGGCMYVSGVPGTGKTATVTGVIRMLQSKQMTEELPPFEFVEINGMRLTEPRQAYVQIYKQLTGKTVSWEQAHSLLEKRFTTPAPRRITTVLLVDELDILCNRRQDVVYNLLDWPTKSAARLVVVTIANTMDLPERLLMGILNYNQIINANEFKISVLSKVTSRLGLTRLTFQPYTHKQLQEIVTMRLNDSEAFKSDAVQLVARKVAAVSGDARRALDICRRATEIADTAVSARHVANDHPTGKGVSIAHVQQALAEMIASAKVQAIKNCSRLEQLFLQAVLAEVTRTGVEETTFLGVYSQMEGICAFEGVTVPTTGNCLRICSKLCSERLLIAEHARTDIFQKILLNVSMDDIHFALRVRTI